MEADVVVNFINFYTYVEEEDDEEILRALNCAELHQLEIDLMIEEIFKSLADSDNL